MFAAARNYFGKNDYQEIEGSETSSVNSMDLNGDGIVTPDEVKQYVEIKLADRLKNVVNKTPNSVTGCLTNAVLGGALVAASTYIPNLDSDIAYKMNIAGFAMLGTSASGLIGSSAKWAFGKPLPENSSLKEIRVDPTRIV